MDQELIEATLRFTEASTREWDVIVIGSGPAGAIAALECAGNGLAALLLDRKNFPRPKVCGGCLNEVALDQLAHAGLAGLPMELGAQPIHSFRLGTRGAEASMALPGGVALTRHRLDAGLVRAAIKAGVQFLPHTSATDAGSERHHRLVSLRNEGQRGMARARLVIAADGLAGGFTRGLSRIVSTTAPDAYIGLGACLREDCGYSPGVIHMATHRQGYVGLVRVEDGLLNVAAALDPQWLHSVGSPAEAMSQVLAGVGWPIPGKLKAGRLQGTPSLSTFRTPVAAERVLLIGDAAGYLEPFTGEGMAWALLGGRMAAALAISALSANEMDTLTARWDETYNAVLGNRRRICSLLTRWLRRPYWVNIGVRVLAVAPILSRPIIKILNATGATNVSYNQMFASHRSGFPKG
jgi:flavin-dependent dehydrogenase